LSSFFTLEKKLRDDDEPFGLLSSSAMEAKQLRMTMSQDPSSSSSSTLDEKN
jgi:hypothetical protein